MKVGPLVYNKLVHQRWMTRRYVEKRIRRFFDIDNSTLLDFGCGTGNHAFIFNPTRYAGIDIDKNRIEYAQRRYPMYRFIRTKPGETPFAAGEFEIVFICFVLHHMSDVDITSALTEVRRVLAPEGSVVVLEPYWSEEPSLNNAVMNCFDAGEYIRRNEKYQTLLRSVFPHVRQHETFSTLNFYNVVFYSCS